MLDTKIATRYPEDNDPRGYGEVLPDPLLENAAQAWRWGYIAARDDLSAGNFTPSKGGIMRASRRVFGLYRACPSGASWSWEQLLARATREAFVAGTQWLASPPQGLCEKEAERRYPMPNVPALDIPPSTNGVR